MGAFEAVVVSVDVGIASADAVPVVPLVVAIVLVYRGMLGERMRLVQALRLL